MTATLTTRPTEAQNDRQRARQDVFHLHAVFNRISSTPSGANCDRSRRSRKGGVELQKTYSKKGVRASWTKQRCGSRLCPRCSPIRSYQDRRRLAIAVEEHVRQRGTTLFLTFTARTVESYTPAFSNAEYVFRRDEAAFSAFRAADDGLPRAGAKARLKAAAAEYGVENGISSNSHEQWELHRRLNDFRTVLARSVFDRTEWKMDSADYNIKGRVDVVELVPQPRVRDDGTRDWNHVTHNLHFHVAVFVEGTLDENDRNFLSTMLIERWTKGIRRRGYEASYRAQDARWVASSDVNRVMNYITKFSDELVFGKPADTTKLSVWDALIDADGGRVDEDGYLIPADPAARQWFRQVEQVFQGRRMMNTSIGFFKKMGVAERIAEQETEWRKNSITETVLTFSGGTWQLIHEENPEFKYELLNAAENAPVEYVYELVDSIGYNYARPAQLTIADLPDDDEPF